MKLDKFLRLLARVPEGSYAEMLENITQRQLDAIEERGGRVQMQQAINAFGTRGFTFHYDDASETMTLRAPVPPTCSMCGADVSGSMCFSCGSAQ